MTKQRFQLFNYAGKPVRNVVVERVELPDAPKNVVPEVTHHVFLVDCSGSMYYDLPALRTMIEKLLTLEEYRDSSMLATLISYSSSGDVTVHFARKTIAEILRPGSAEVEQIRSMHVKGLTCISQAFDKGKEYIRPSETTAVSLHSDGYANDRSPTAEKRELDRICDELESMSNVFVNTIAYSSYADFQLLAHIANRMSGKCVQAQNVKQVYDALHDTSSLLAGRMSPAISIDLNGADQVVFVSRSAMRVNGGSTDLVMRGIRPEDDRVAYRYTFVTDAMYASLNLPVCDVKERLECVYALSMASLAEGKLNQSKFAMMSTRDNEIILANYKALTNNALAAMYLDLGSRIFTGGAGDYSLATFYGLGFTRTPLTKVLDTIGQYASKGEITVQLSLLQERYKRRGLKRRSGSYDENGVFSEARIDSAFSDLNPDHGHVSSFDLNNANATVNMLVKRPISLVDTYGDFTGEKGAIIDEVAGIELSGKNQLYAFNNYTIVGDGELNVDQIWLRFESNRAFRAAMKVGIIPEGTAFDPLEFYCIELGAHPLVDFDTPFGNLDLSHLFQSMARAASLKKITSALLTKASDRFTAEQLEELGKVYLTKSLNFSPPTCNPYFDMKDAASKGLIDTRVNYEVKVGTTEILALTDLHSGNELIDRFFTSSSSEKKVRWDEWWNSGVSFAEKQLSSRTKITPIDDVMKPIVSDFLGFEDNGAVATVLHEAGAEPELVAELVQITRNRKAMLQSDTAGIVETFTDADRVLGKYIDHCYESIRDLVFFIGSTGLLPDGLEAEMYTADTMKQKYDKLKIGSKQAEGTFFVHGESVLSVYATNVQFSVDRSVQVASN